VVEPLHKIGMEIIGRHAQELRATIESEVNKATDVRPGNIGSDGPDQPAAGITGSKR